MGGRGSHKKAQVRCAPSKRGTEGQGPNLHPAYPSLSWRLEASLTASPYNCLRCCAY